MKQNFFFLLALFIFPNTFVISQALFFPNQVHDFGNINKGDTLTYIFELTNPSSKIAQIKEVVAPCGACGCVTVAWDKKPFKYGRKAKITVKFTDFPYSNFQRVVEVYYNSIGKIGNDKVVLLAIKGQLNIPLSNTVVDTSQKTLDSLALMKTKKPKEINLFEIQKNIGYPSFAREYGIEERIIFKTLIDEEGNYIRHLHPKEGHILLISNIENHLCKIRFTPAMRDEKPIKFWANIPFHFRLQ